MARDFVIIHGLPGAGKTSLCKLLAEKTGGFYANIGAAEDFRKAPMAEVCARLLLTSDAHLPFFTEGVCPNPTARDTFIYKVITILSNRNIIINNPLIVFLDEPITTLACRRNRSSEAYAEYFKEMEFGSKKYDYKVYTCEGEGLEERLARIMPLLD